MGSRSVCARSIICTASNKKSNCRPLHPVVRLLCCAAFSAFIPLAGCAMEKLYRRSYALPGAWMEGRLLRKEAYEPAL